VADLTGSAPIITPVSIGLPFLRIVAGSVTHTCCHYRYVRSRWVTYSENAARIELVYARS
jgi:hypothetical protein